jgi:GATA-binding protein
VLRDSLFPTWKDDAGEIELDSPEEMQKKDPLATQVWKLYSRAKAQLPNAERMENLTWRMMSINMKKQELERQRFVDIDHVWISPMATQTNLYLE